MSARYDLERLISDIQAHVVANLNTKVTAISAEKGDGVSLPALASTSFGFNSVDAYSGNEDPFCVIAFESLEATGIGPAIAKTAKIDVVLILTAHQDPAIDKKRVLRFHRAIEEIFLEGWQGLSRDARLKLQALTPVPIQLLGTHNTQRLVGVQLEVTTS